MQGFSQSYKMLDRKRKSLKLKKCLQVPSVQIPFQSQPSIFKLPDLFDTELYNFEKNVYKKNLKPRMRNKITQTDFRDSETQTVPWEPPYVIKSGNKIFFRCKVDLNI